MDERPLLLIVEDDERVVAVLALGDDLFELAFADVGRRVRRLEPLDGAPGDLGASGVRKKRQLIERGLGSEAVSLAPRLDGDEEGALLYRRCGVGDRLLGALLQ